MTTRTQLFALGPACASLLGCAATPTELTGGFSHFDSRELIYDELVLDVIEPGMEPSMDVALQTSGDGAREGVKMMLQAPVGCLQGGMFAVVCLALAPFFPLMAANNVQDVEMSQAELDVMAERIDHAAMQRRFREVIETEAREAGLPLVESASPGARVATLHAELGRPSLEHDGNEGGQITVTQPYRFSLSYADNEMQTVIEDARWDRFDVDDGYIRNNAELAEDFERWIPDAARRGLRDTVIEWQPKVVLGPVAPSILDKRNAIGIMQTRYPFVESTTPRLAWQPLESVLEPDVFADVTDVSYQLEIFRAGNRRLVTGLEMPEYAVAEPLEPCAYYRWRPIARFRYRGVVHTTSPNMHRWSKTDYVEDDFKFKTPAAECKDPVPSG